MKAALLTGIRRFEVREVSDPILVRDTDVLVRLTTVGVCGSDIHYYTHGRIGSQEVQFPFIIGHEAAGVVEKTGNLVTRVKAGQRIAIDPAISCGQCDQCKAGREHTCRQLLFLGCPGQREGTLAERIILPEQCCYPINEATTFEQAALAEPLSIAVYAVERSAPLRNGTVAILGAGPIGLSVFHVLRTRDVGNVYITDRIPERLTFAGRLNPTWRGNPDQTDVVQEIIRRQPGQLDMVYECSGDTAALAQAVQLLKPGGSLVIVGIPEVDDVTFPIHDLRRKEITILNIRRQNHCTQKALDLLARGGVDLDAMVTHRFTLEDTSKAFDLVAHYKDGVMKAMIEIT